MAMAATGDAFVLSFVGLPHICRQRQEIAATPPRELRIRDQKWESAIVAAFVSQGEAVPIEVRGRESEKYRIVAASGKLSRDGANRWVWHAPSEPGLYPLTVTDEPGRHATTVNAFVKVPASAITNGRLNGYHWTISPASGAEKPRGLCPEGSSVTAQSGHAPRAFPPAGFPLQAAERLSDVVLRELIVARLLRVVGDGFDVSTLHLMSVRTPSYNKAIGNVPYSMHLFGGAADVIADIDLNRDQRIDRQDAVALAGLVDEVEHDGDSAITRGGVGIYKATQAHGPFVHVDVRAASARWGE